MTIMTIQGDELELESFMATNLCLDEVDRAAISSFRRLDADAYETSEGYQIEVIFSIGSDDEYLCLLKSNGGPTMDFWSFEDKNGEEYGDDDKVPTADAFSFGDLLGVIFHIAGSALYEIRHATGVIG